MPQKNTKQYGIRNPDRENEHQPTESKPKTKFITIIITLNNSNKKKKTIQEIQEIGSQLSLITK